MDLNGPLISKPFCCVPKQRQVKGGRCCEQDGAKCKLAILSTTGAFGPREDVSLPVGGLERPA
jgi:hypothetical protein